MSAANFTEIDFFETWGHVYSGTPGSWQINIYGDARAFHTTGFLPASSRHAWNAEWHTLGMLWQPGLMTFFMDNQQVWQQAYTSAQSSIDSQSLFLILGTGRDWLVNVDWVRVLAGALTAAWWRPLRPSQVAPGVPVCVEDKEVYMEPGSAWWSDNQRLHAVFNNSDQDRIPMFTDTRSFQLADG